MPNLPPKVGPRINPPLLGGTLSPTAVSPRVAVEMGVVVAEVGAMGDDVSALPLNRIDPDPDQPRHVFDEEAMLELEASIRARGVLQPIMVRPHPTTPGRWMIVMGERRYQATRRAGLATIPARVRAVDPSDTTELLIMQLEENVVRADLTPIEEARAFRRLLDLRAPVSIRKLAAIVHKSRTHISNRLLLLEDPRIVAALEADAISLKEATTIARARDTDERTTRAAPTRDGDSPGGVDSVTIVDAGLDVPDGPDARAVGRTDIPAPADDPGAAYSATREEWGGRATVGEGNAAIGMLVAVPSPDPLTLPLDMPAVGSAVADSGVGRQPQEMPSTEMEWPDAMTVRRVLGLARDEGVDIFAVIARAQDRGMRDQEALWAHLTRDNAPASGVVAR